MEWAFKTLLERIKDRYTELDTVYDRLNDARESIVDLFRPDLGVDYDESADMLMLGGDIYEGSGPWVARTASTAFQGNTVSKKLDWRKYAFSDKRLDGIDELDEFCQDVKEHTGAVFQRGNFYDVQPQFTLDAWTVGSPLYFVEEDPETGFVMCLPQHFKTYRIFYDRFGRDEGVVIKDEQWTAKKCFDKFCNGQSMDDRLARAEKIFTPGLYNAIKDGLFDRRFVIWRAVFKANEPLWNGSKEFKRPLGGKTWYDVYFENTCLKDKQDTPLLTGGYYSKPFVHWDYNKKSWESASRTPAFEAIYDNLSLQQIFKNYLDNLQLKVRPSMVALLAMKGRLNFGVEGVTYINQNEWNYLPKPIEQVGDIRLEAETMQMFRENLSRHFHLEMFRMFIDLAQTANSKDFRVLQLAEMAGERITQLLPTIETHESYLAQVDERVRDIERQAGRGPFARANLENIMDILDWAIGPEASTARINPEFIGTLRQTQQMQQKLKPIQYGIGALSELAASMGDPNLVRFMVKGYDVGDEALRAVNFPQKLVREVEDYEKMVRAFEQMQAQREQFAKTIEMLKATKANAQGAMEPNSPAGMLMAGGQTA